MYVCVHVYEYVCIICLCVYVCIYMCVYAYQVTIKHWVVVRYLCARCGRGSTGAIPPCTGTNLFVSLICVLCCMTVKETSKLHLTNQDRRRLCFAKLSWSTLQHTSTMSALKLKHHAHPQVSPMLLAGMAHEEDGVHTSYQFHKNLYMFNKMKVCCMDANGSCGLWSFW